MLQLKCLVLVAIVWIYAVAVSQGQDSNRATTGEDCRIAMTAMTRLLELGGSTAENRDEQLECVQKIAGALQDASMNESAQSGCIGLTRVAEILCEDKRCKVLAVEMLDKVVPGSSYVRIYLFDDEGGVLDEVTLGISNRATLNSPIACTVNGSASAPKAYVCLTMQAATRDQLGTVREVRWLRGGKAVKTTKWSGVEIMTNSREQFQMTIAILIVSSKGIDVE